jgi:hypothetical protein
MGLVLGRFLLVRAGVIGFTAFTAGVAFEVRKVPPCTSKVPQGLMNKRWYSQRYQCGDTPLKAVLQSICW